MSTMRTRMVTVMLAAVVLATMCASAQWAPPGPGGPPDRPGPGMRPQGRMGPGGPMPVEDAPEVREMVETVMVARLAKELALDDEQTVVMLRRVKEFGERVRQFARERQELLQDLRSAVRAGVHDEEIEGKLRALMEKDRQLAESQRRMFERLSEGYTPTQRAKLYVAMGDFEREIRRLVARARERFAEGREGPMPMEERRRMMQERRMQELHPEGPRPQPRRRPADGPPMRPGPRQRPVDAPGPVE